VLVNLPRASASSDVVERLVDWNLDLTRARSAAERSRIYAGQADNLNVEVRQAALPDDERELAVSLLENAPWLAAHDDPLAEAARFNDVADKIVRRMTSATRRGDVRRAQRYARLYRQVEAMGIEDKLKRLEASGALDFDRQRRLEHLVVQDADRMQALLDLLDREPDSTRKEIKRALGLTRKTPRHAAGGPERPRKLKARGDGPEPSLAPAP
jgi:hypothetical protein